MIAIEQIYDAAFDRNRFPELIEQLCHSFHAQSGVIGWSDDRNSGFQAQFGGDPMWSQRYVETDASQDILRPMLMALKEGEWATSWSQLQQHEVRKSQFYRDYLAPQNIVDNLAVKLIKRPNISAHLALIRQGEVQPFSPEDCARLSALTTHLRRAIFIQSQFIHASNGRPAFSITTSPVLLLSEERQLLDCSPSLLPLLRLRVGEIIREGRLGVAIHTAITEDVSVPLVLEDHEGGADGIAVLLEAQALSPDRFGDFVAGPGATHAVQVTRLDQPPVIAFDAFASLYRLTATELRVLRDALEQSDLIGIGERLGMARATTRTHLHRIYEKTGTKGFAGLSNLAHRFIQGQPK